MRRSAAYAKPLFIGLVLVIVLLIVLLSNMDQNKTSAESNLESPSESKPLSEASAENDTHANPDNNDEPTEPLGSATAAKELQSDNPDLPSSRQQALADNDGVKMIPEPEELQDGNNYDDDYKFGPNGPSIENPTEVLTETETARIEVAALNYVVFAYGYSGGPGEKAGNEYMTGVLHAVAPDFFAGESPGKEAVEQYRKVVIEEGTDSTAYLDDFRIENATEEQVSGTLYFHIETAGTRQKYQQEITVKDYFNRWQIFSAETLKEVS